MKTLSILHTVIPPHTRAIDRSCALIISLGLECLCTPQLAFDQHVSIFYTAVWTGSPDEEREQENVGFWLFALYGMAHGQHLRRCLFMRTVFTYASMHTGFACVFVCVRAHARVGISTDQYIPPCCHLCPGRLQAAPYTLTLFLQPHTVSVHFGLFGTSEFKKYPHMCVLVWFLWCRHLCNYKTFLLRPIKNLQMCFILFRLLRHWYETFRTLCVFTSSYV